MACSGYPYGVFLGGLLVRATGKKVLVLDGDVQSAYVSKTDKATVPVLADIGTATLLVPDDSAAEWQFAFYTDGAPREVLYVPAGGTRRPTQASDLQPVTYEDGSQRRDADIYMDGFEIFRFVAQTASKFIKEFMEAVDVQPGALDAFVPHQANMYMIGQLARKLKIDQSVMWKSGDRYGNPSSGSVPLTIAHHAAGGEPTQAPHTLIAGFGGGLSVGVGLIELPADASYDVINYHKDYVHG